MKLKISTIIDIPEEYVFKEEEYRLSSAVQIVFDDITNYVTCKHLQDTTKWCCIAKVDTDDEKEFNEKKNDVNYRIYRHHKTWSEICEGLKWEYEEIK